MSHPFHPTIATLVALLSLLAGASIARAQGPGADQVADAGGTLYVVAFPDTTTNSFDARYPNNRYVDKAILMIYSAVDATVSIKGRGYTNNVTTAGGSFTVVELMGGAGPNASAPIVIEHCKAVGNTFRVESDVPIILYQYLVTRFGTEAWTPLPVDAWGREYYAAAMPGEVGSNIYPGADWDYNRRNKMFPAEILVVAAYDDTRITIAPQGRVHNDCRTDSVLLMAGEAYQIESWVDTLTANVGVDQPDFGGSRITATKPIGVVTGNTRAQIVDENVGLGKNAFKNMLIEWLSPVEQWGTEFVYMPTWDTTRATGGPSENPAGKRKAEIVRVYGGSIEPTSGYYMQAGVPVPYDTPIDTGDFVQIRHTPVLGRVHRTEAPAQAFMSSVAVVKYAGTTGGSGGYIGAAYDAWGGYMVELTPRERWVSFAPFYASTHPGGMEHHINVVTDTVHRNDVYLETGNRFAFTRPIEGTRFIWGSMKVQPGVDHWLEGRNGARFAGFVYGTLTQGGHEEFRPSRTRSREEDRQEFANRGGGDDESAMPMAPAAYEEYLAIAYGYPLAASRNIIGPGDSLEITTVIDCRGMCVTIRALNADPVGLRSYRLENADNAKIVSVDPYPPAAATPVTICIAPVNPGLDASAMLVLTDHSGKTTRIPFTYFGERADVTPGRLDYGVMTPGASDTMDVTIANPLGRALTVLGVGLASGNSAFSILAPTSFPITIAPQESITVRVRANPTSPDMSYVDTVVVRLACSEIRIRVTAGTGDPCLQVGDLDFGTLSAGQSLTRPLRISNDGFGAITFVNPGGGDVVEWQTQGFTISAADLARLEAASLSRGDNIAIDVTFTATAVGEFRDTARIWASTRKCRDISFWNVRVMPPAAAPSETGTVTALDVAQPNPTTGPIEIRFTLARRSHTTLVVYDERGGRVARLLDDVRGAGAHAVRFDASMLPAGVYHYRLTSAGESHVRSFVKK